MGEKKLDGAIAAPRLPRRAVAAALPAIEDQGTYTGLVLSGGELIGQRAEDVTFEGVHFKQVAMSRTQLPGLRLADARLDACDLAEAEWEQASLCRVELVGCRMIGLRASEGLAQDVLFKGCNGAYAQFWSTTFKGARFERCALSEANFQGAELSGAVFDTCDLSGAKMTGARLQGADLRGSKLDGAWLGLQELQGAIVDLDQAISIVRLLGVVVRLD